MEINCFIVPRIPRKLKNSWGKTCFRIISKPIAISWLMKGLRLLVLTFWVHFPSSLSSEAVYVKQMDQIVAQLTH